MPNQQQPEAKRDKREECVVMTGDGELLFMDGFDDAILGVADRFGMETVVAYDFEKVISMLMTQCECDREGALEFYSFNQIGAWMGERTPLFVRRLE